MQPSLILRRIIDSLRDLFTLFRPKARSSMRDKMALHYFSLPEQRYIPRPGRWVQWSPPIVEMYKLNTDGSSIAGVCSGGGIIWDRQGQSIRAFSHFYGDGTNMRAEILALRDDLQLCRHLGFTSVMVESDSLVAVSVLKKRQNPPWLYVYDLQRCQELIGSFVLAHVFREQNHAADRLAAWAHAHQDAVIVDCLDSLPRDICLAIFNDLNGLYSYRK